jgi:hypothetical protein
MAAVLSPTIPKGKLDYLHQSVEPVIRPLLNQAAFIQPEHFLQWLASSLQGSVPEVRSPKNKINAKIYLEREVTPVLRPLFVQAVKTEPTSFGNWLSSRLAEMLSDGGTVTSTFKLAGASNIAQTESVPARAVPTKPTPPGVVPTKATPAVNPRTKQAKIQAPVPAIAAKKVETWFGPGVVVGRREGELQILKLAQMGATAYLQKPAVDGKIKTLFGNGVVKHRRASGVQVADCLDMGAIGFLQPSAIDGSCDTAFGRGMVEPQGPGGIYVANLMQIGATGYLQQSAVVSMVDTAFGLGAVQRQLHGGVQVLDLAMGATGYLQQPAVGRIDTRFGKGLVHGQRAGGIHVAELQQMGATGYLQSDAVVGEQEMQWMLRLAAY